jgi:hypothetical protein
MLQLHLPIVNDLNGFVDHDAAVDGSVEVDFLIEGLFDLAL